MGSTGSQQQQNGGDVGSAAVEQCEVDATDANLTAVETKVLV